MKEEFLHYAWKTRQFHPVSLCTTDGQTLEIISPGDHNRDSGPDFFNAKVRIGGMLWSGNVELHIRTSDWLKHGHQLDEAYNNVILHVVYEHDISLLTNYGKPMPTLELKTRMDEALRAQYLFLQKNTEAIACCKSLPEIPRIEMTNWLARMWAERLENKVTLLQSEFLQNDWDWEETFYRHLARQFGMKINAEPFQLLAMSLPFRVLARQSELLQTEALLFGQAGLLEEEVEEVYAQALRREYKLLKRKYSLTPLQVQHWKFMRLRPHNFPTLRLAQFAGLFFRQPQLFRKCMETEKLEELHALLNVRASAYWNTHYRFGKISKPVFKQLGAQATETILINTIVPFKFLYGRSTGNENLVQHALEWMETIGPEKNRVMREWEMAGVHAVSAAETQGLLELKRNYCEKKRCLECQVGQLVLGRKVRAETV